VKTQHLRVRVLTSNFWLKFSHTFQWIASSRRTVWALAEIFSTYTLSTMGYLLVVVEVLHCLLFLLGTLYQLEKTCSARSGSLVTSVQGIWSRLVSFERAHRVTSKTAFKSLCDSKLTEIFYRQNRSIFVKKSHWSKKCSVEFSMSNHRKSLARPGSRWGSAPVLKISRLMRTVWIFSLKFNKYELCSWIWFVPPDAD
jgi:hypothetical protein